jgi:hypothetical protein
VRNGSVNLAKGEAKMLGKSPSDIVNLLNHEFTLPETDGSWKKRQDLLIELSEFFEQRKEKSVFSDDIVRKVKSVIPHIVTTAGAERTTLSNEACRALSNIAKNLESHIQSHLDNILPGLITVCGSTKTVAQKNANDTIINVCKHSGYNQRLFYHVCAAFRDSRIPPRIYAPEWLRILIKTYKPQMDWEKDGSACEKAIFSGLTDGQVKVRENSRAVFWAYQSYDARGARKIMGGLNTHAQKALNADSNNPDKAAASAAKADVAPRPKSALASIKAQNKERLALAQKSEPNGRTVDVTQLAPVDTEDCKLFEPTEQREAPMLTAAPVRRRVVATPMPLPTSTTTAQRTTAKTTTTQAPIPIPRRPKDAPPQPHVPTVRKDRAGNLWPPRATTPQDNVPVAEITHLDKEHVTNKKLLSIAIEGLRRQNLDGLGYRRLVKLFAENPNLITNQDHFNEMIQLLVGNMTRLDLVNEAREHRQDSFAHPIYSIHIILHCIMLLFSQYPEYPEPQPGMVLSALVISRCMFSTGYTSTLAQINEASLTMCRNTVHIPAALDHVLDTLQTLESIISSNDHIVTPMSTDTVLFNSLQSLASEFGPQKPQHAARLPIVMDFGLDILLRLLFILGQSNGSLSGMLQDRMGRYAEYLLANYSSQIKRKVIRFCTLLHDVVASEEEFYSYFKSESDKNLIVYYVDTHGSL